MRKVISILFAIFLLANISVISVYASYTLTNDAYTVANYARAAVGTHEMSKKGLCQTFAWECLYNTLGVSNKAGCGCCATKAWQSYGVSSSRDDIPLGAMVYFGGSSTIDRDCGQEAGHVGVYIGNNEIAHAWSSTVICKTTIDYVITCGYYYRGWGWQGGYPLATIEKPNRANISVNKSNFKIGEEFTLSLSADVYCQYYLSIYDSESGELIIGENVSSTYKNAFQKAGRYSAYMSAFNSKGSVDSNWVDFYVYNNAPTVASLSIKQYAFKVGESITFTNYANDCCEYYMSIYNSDGEIIDCGNKSQSYTITINSPGYYSAAMSAHNPLGTAHSNWVSFYVYENAPTYSKLSVDKTEFAVGESITFTNYADDCCEYYMSIYNSDGEIIDCGNKSQSYTTTINSPGYYSVAMSAHNPLGTAHSNWVSFHVYSGAPTYATLSLNTDVISVGDSVKLITETDADYVRVYTSIYKENTLMYSGWIPNEFEYTPLEEGIYNICASAYTIFGTSHTNWIDLYVGKYNIYYNANGGTIQNSTQNKTYGKSIIIFDEIPIRVGYTFTGWNTKNDGTGMAYNPGDTYTVNESITLYAQWEETIPDTDSSVSQIGSNYFINVVPIDVDDSCNIIIAAYKGSKFVTLKSIPYEFNEINTTLSGDIDEIKVMVLDSLSGLKPLSKAEVIPSSKFISE